MALSKVDPNFLNVSQIGGRRNLLYNGAMMVAQRGTSSSSVTNNTYNCADRFIHIHTGGGYDITQSTDAPTGFLNSYKVACSTADGTLDASDRLNIAQKLEGNDVMHLAYGSASAKTITVSFWCKSNLTGTYALEAYNYNGAYHLTKNYTINSANTWEYKTVTFAGDTSNSINSGTGLGISFWWWLRAGSTYNSGALSSSWNTTDNQRANGQTVDLASSTSNYFNLTGCQVEIGDTATSFEHRSYVEELALCQRYYHQGMYAFMSSSATTLMYNINFPVTMRSTPTETHRYPEGAGAVTNDVYNIATAATPTFVPDGNFADVNGLRFAYDFDAGLTADDGYQSYFTFSAEL